MLTHRWVIATRLLQEQTHTHTENAPQSKFSMYAHINIQIYSKYVWICAVAYCATAPSTQYCAVRTERTALKLQG